MWKKTDQFQLPAYRKDVKPPTKEGQKELSKKQLVKLCKTNLSAQVANHAWNRCNSIINHKVKELSTQNKVNVLQLQSTLFIVSDRVLAKIDLPCFLT